MSRRDSERIYIARKAAAFRLLVDAYRMDELAAEHWIARGEREAETRGVGRLSPEFWPDGGAWIMEQRSSERR